MQKNISEISQEYGKIFGVTINSTERKGVLRRIQAFLAKDTDYKLKSRSFSLVSINPEIVLQAQKDPYFLKSLNESDISVPDGIGLVQAVKFLELKKASVGFLGPFLYLFQGFEVGLRTVFNPVGFFGNLKPVKGRELFLDLISLANKKSWKVFLFGGQDGEAKETEEVLKRSFKKLKIKSLDGPALDKRGMPVAKEDRDLERQAIEKINDFSPDILFLAFSPPKQEKWFYRNKNLLNVGGAMMVGGTFRYISGKSKLPPKWMESLGLEWLWRLLTEPKRVLRIFRAFPIFPLKVFFYKCKS